MAYPYIVDKNNTTSTFFRVEGVPLNYTNKYQEIDRPGYPGHTLLWTGSKPNDAVLNVDMNFSTENERVAFKNYIQNNVLSLFTYYNNYGSWWNLRLMDVKITREWQVFKPIGGGGYWIEMDLTVRTVKL